MYTEEGTVDQETYNHTQKNYPTATKSALLNIRKKELEKSQFNTKHMLAMPNARQSPNRSPSPEHNEIYNYSTLPVSPIESPANGLLRPRSGVIQTRPNSGILRLSSSKYANRPISAFTSIGNRPISAISNTGNLNQVMSLTNLFADNKKEQSAKTRLYSASTLGFTLVPTISRTVSTPTIILPIFQPQIPAKINSKDRFGYTKTEDITPNETYAQRIRKGRPLSPNPTEVWAKKYQVNLSSSSSKPILKQLSLDIDI